MPEMRRGPTVKNIKQQTDIEEAEMDSSETNVTSMEQSNKEPSEAMAVSHRRSKKKWKDFSSAQKTRIVVQATIQMALAAWALWDIRHRSADRIKGSKRLWTLAAFVQPVGPIAYMLFGRKK